MAAPRRHRGVEVKIVEPADEFEIAAGLDKAPEFLREEDLGRHPALDLMHRAVVVDIEGHAFVVGLGNRVDNLGAVAHPHRDAATPPRPGS